MKISIVVPNWNGMEFVGMCLDSLSQLDFEGHEVIVVDNGSQDGSREMIEKKYPWVILLKLPENMGFAIACNEGIKASKAEYIVLLNNDIEVTPDWLKELYEGMERHPECGMGTTKMMFLDNRDVFYNTGDLFHSWSSGGGRGQGEKIPANTKKKTTFLELVPEPEFTGVNSSSKWDFSMKTSLFSRKMSILICVVS